MPAAPDLAGSPRPDGIDLVDAFEDRSYLAGKPTRLCVAVNVMGAGTKNAAARLLCHRLKLAKGEPRHDALSPIHTSDSLGPEQLTSRKQKEVCVPAVIGP